MLGNLFGHAYKASQIASTVEPDIMRRMTELERLSYKNGFSWGTTCGNHIFDTVARNARNSGLNEADQFILPIKFMLSQAIADGNPEMARCFERILLEVVFETSVTQALTNQELDKEEPEPLEQKRQEREQQGRDRRTGATLDSVYQAPALKPQSQAPGGANSKVTNVEQRDEIEDYPRAAIAIKYRAEIAPDWSKVCSLPSELRRMYLEKLDDNPDIDARELYAMVDERLKQDAAPFADDQTNKMYASLAQYGAEAQRRFRDIHDVLGVSFNAERVANEISKDYSIEKFLEHINPGRYRTDKNLHFIKFPAGDLILVSINGVSQGTKRFSVSNFLIRYGEYSKDLRSAFAVDIMPVKRADGKLVEITTDMNRFWVTSYLGEKCFSSITEVFDFLGTPLGYRKV